VGVADTGLDMRVCFLQDTSIPTPYNTVNNNHRKVVSYISYADSQEVRWSSFQGVTATLSPYLELGHSSQL
jgi:hypothetical protein